MARIYGNHYLDQPYSKGKRPLKMNVNFYDKQQPKAIPLPAKTNPLPSNQSEVSEKTGKEKKKKMY